MTLQDPMMPSPYRVRGVRKETADTFTLEIEPEQSDPGFAFASGQFNMLYVFGVGEVPISISGDPSSSGTLRHTTRAVGAVTKAMCKLKRGQMLGVRGPFGTHWPVEVARGKDVVLVAGGIGLAPLRPVIYQMLAHRADYGRISLLYGARTPADILYKKELERWRSKFDLNIFVTVDRASAGWRGSVGVVTTLLHHAAFTPANTLAMLCGPEVMMRFTIQGLLQGGMQLENIYLSMERNMKCAVGFCGHCQVGPHFICKDGPVFRYDKVLGVFGKAEV